MFVYETFLFETLVDFENVVICLYIKDDGLMHLRKYATQVFMRISGSLFFLL